MSLITANSLSKSFGAEDLFRDVSFSIAKGARFALVGPNGIGKTTLLRILTGTEEPSSGKVTRAKALRTGYLPQEADFQLQGTVWDACMAVFSDLIRQQGELARLEAEMSDPLRRDEAMGRYGRLQEEFERRGGYTYPVRIKQVLTGLGFDPSDFTLSLDHLSGGQRTRAYLARLLLSNPDLLLLDEPTNHLDIAAVEWLEGYLSQWEGAAVIVSHDRYFLDHSCNALLEMAISGTELYRGNYSTYLQERENRWNHRVEVFEGEREKLLKDVDYIKRNISGQNVQQAKGKLRRLTRVVQAIEQVGMEAVLSLNWSQLDVETTTSPFSVEEAERRVRALRPPQRSTPDLHLHLHTAGRSGELVIRTRELEVGYPDRMLFRAEDIELRRTDCAALIGPNGAGKSTFLKTILGQLEPRQGEVLLGASLHIGYFAQAHEGLDPQHTVLDEILAASPGMLPYQARDYLGRYLFSGDDVFKTVSMLSGGERGRLALAKLALQDTNLLLLDEPTNHLDIPSQEVLQSVLDNYQGTILLVTHDRYLVDALATQIWEIDPQESHLTVFRGTYSQMKEEREKDAARLAAQESAAAVASRAPSAQDDARRARNAQTRDERRKVAQMQELENRIAALESKLAELTSALENPPPDPSEVTKLGREYARVQKDMDAQLAEWERLTG
ncbi:MAG TPA: ABC-F family ATP-binding cassette domain-containing protein [Anaerolineales bacterium]|nr:ABC-F family ATP-binding cassette domain-containing protein [Anaerolineales bacterium]